jgi:hypothetical protein
MLSEPRVATFMKPPSPHLRWDVSSSAVNGCLTGVAVGAVHQVYRAVTNDIPENIYAQVTGEVIAGALIGALLFAGVAVVRNLIRARR